MRVGCGHSTHSDELRKKAQNCSGGCDTFWHSEAQEGANGSEGCDTVRDNRSTVKLESLNPADEFSPVWLGIAPIETRLRHVLFIGTDGFNPVGVGLQSYRPFE